MSTISAVVAAVSGIVSSVTVVIALIYARGQVREGSLSRQAALIQTFQASYQHDPDNRIFRTAFLAGKYGVPTDFDPKSLDEVTYIRFYMMLDQLEFMAVLIDRGLLDFELFFWSFRSHPPRIWAFVEPWVMQQRAGQDPNLPKLSYIHLEKLVGQYNEYYLEHYGVEHPGLKMVPLGQAPGPASPVATPPQP